MGKAYVVWSKNSDIFLRFLTKFWFPRQIFMKFPVTNSIEIISMGKALVVKSKVPDIFLRFLTKSWFPQQIFMKFPITNLMEISPVYVPWIHADRRAGGRTEITLLTAALRDCVNTPKHILLPSREEFVTLRNP
jgi:hypothetical protein